MSCIAHGPQQSGPEQDEPFLDDADLRDSALTELDREERYDRRAAWAVVALNIALSATAAGILGWGWQETAGAMAVSLLTVWWVANA